MCAVVRRFGAAVKPGGLSRAGFLLRWAAPIVLSLMLASFIEYVFAAQQLEQRVLEQSVDRYSRRLEALEAVLAADLTSKEHQEAIEDEVVHLMETYGTEYVGLFDAEGQLIAGSSDDKVSLERDRVREVIASQRPVYRPEDDPAEADEAGRFEFLFPVASSAGPLVLEADQDARIVDALVADLRVRQALGLVLVVFLAVPLSYLFGGWSLHRRQRAAEHAADTDPLTGLPTRRPFHPTLEAALADPSQPPVALALIDIDNFKQLNDRLGHTHGDRVLRALAQSFDALRASDSGFRLGGDEFAVVLPGVDDHHAAEILERVRQQLTAAMPGVTISCGVASAQPGDGVGQQELWERADSALYEAKRLGRNRSTTFSGISAQFVVTADKLEAVSALFAPETECTVVFQPIWDLRTGRLLAHEALLRLPASTPLNGPAEAFDLAHRLGAAGRLDRLARRTILAAVAERQWHGLLFLNLHPDALRELDVDAFVDEIRAVGLAPSDVVVEITEHADLDSAQHLRVLKRIRSRGFRLALDDLGQGNAGLRALTHVQFDIIKLDRQVIARLGIDPASDATVAAATIFARQTGGWLIAEGIEEPTMLNALLDDTQRLAAHDPVVAGQGYLLGHPSADPLPAETTFTAPEKQPKPASYSSA